ARRQLLALAVETQRTSELVLKELIVGGTSDELWNMELDPTDQPRTEAKPIRSGRGDSHWRSTGARTSRVRDAGSTPTKRPPAISATARCLRSTWSAHTN
ncbi:MAG: hypothetical protein OXG42_04445, partial [Chloroflexi bacterium]|nr:hypothetical protein [Chloroflexota bacterium]